MHLLVLMSCLMLPWCREKRENLKDKSNKSSWVTKHLKLNHQVHQIQKNLMTSVETQLKHPSTLEVIWESATVRFYTPERYKSIWIYPHPISWSVTSWLTCRHGSLWSWNVLLLIYRVIQITGHTKIWSFINSDALEVSSSIVIKGMRHFIRFNPEIKV